MTIQRSRLGGSLFGTAATVGALAATVKVASLLKDTLVAQYFGSGASLDAFLLALVVPSFLISVAAGTLPSALTPVYVDIREHQGARAAHALATRVLVSMYKWMGALSVIASLASLGYGHLPKVALAPATIAALPWLALCLAPYTFLQGVCAAWSGLLAADGEYFTSTLAPMMQPLAMAASLAIAGNTHSPMVLVIGLLLGTLAQGALLLRALLTHGHQVLRWTPAAALDAEGVRRVRDQYLPAIASTVLMSATVLIDQTMAAWLPAGSVSSLGYGIKASALFVGVGAMALSTTLLPTLSLHVARADWVMVRRIERRVRFAILATTVPLTAALIWGSAPLVRLLFERGAFTTQESLLVTSVQQAYLLQIPVHLVGILYVRLASALEANRLLTMGSALNLVANVVFNVLFMHWYGVTGIALSTSGVYAVSCLYLAWAARRQLALAEQRRPALTIARPSIVEVPCASAA